MCSVIEIKNANEYYIHYHSPESLNPNELNGLKKMEAVDIKEAQSAKDAEVTSDRGSSASPSLEDEEEQGTKNEPQITAKEQQRPPRPEQNGSSPSKIPVRKKLAPQPPVKKKAPQPPNNPFIEDSPKSSRLPRPKGTAASNAKLTPARSLESVPITVNSHIPASPLRPVSSKKVSSKVTSEMGTQVDNHKKSVSVENLSSAKASKHQLRKTSSESADQILDQGKKWSYTNGAITTDLRQYLNTRFPKGGVDHELQNTIRDNLYLRTVPVTTRTPRPEERNGVDYTFLSKDEFIALERTGELLESGVFEGNHYGTPKPSKDSVQKSIEGPPGPNSNLHGGVSNVNFPGAHPSSEGKRRRNRSNVEAMTAKHSQNDSESSSQNQNSETKSSEDLNQGTTPETPSGSTSTTKSGGSSGQHAADSGHPDSPDVPENPEGPPPMPAMPNGEVAGGPHDPLGPLPPNWEKAYTDKGESYFIDHNSGTSHWLDPRLSRVKKKRPEDCTEDELPFGWERIDDPHYGTYFIDHVNRRTQYENPVLIAKAANQSADAIMTTMDQQYPMGPAEYPPDPPGPQAGTFPRGAKKTQSPFFTRDPTQLRGERIRTQLVKSMQGLGFTIVGGDDNVEEFLQIKSVVPNGPAWLDGNLKTGDVLVYVNDTCVLGFTHHDMVTMFQSISSGEAVNLEVCRGYPLPFDPDDPNTEIVTTVAVTSPGQNEWASELERQRSSDVQSMPDLSGANMNHPALHFRPSSADLLGNGNPDFNPGNPNDIMTVPITKGGMGFGFTIADSAFGQKVKKILDRPRCKTLQEGDVLIEINSKSVRGMSHSEVVQVLKECSRGSEASITIQRGLLPAGTSGTSGSSPGKKFKKGDSGSGLLKPKSGFLFRSKTPTAELYSTQEREKVPNRPKTPLVNMSVSRSKTPTSMGAAPFQRNDITRASLGGHFSDQSGTGTNSGFNPYNALSDRMASVGLYETQNQNSQSPPQNPDYGNRSRSPGRELDENPVYGNQGQGNYYNDYNYDQYANYQQQVPNQQPGQVPVQQQNYYNGYPENTEPGYGYMGYSPQQQQQQQQTGQQNYRSGSLPRSVRKESTSFEHSEPLPGNLTRWPRPEPGRLHNGEAYVELTVTLQRHDSGFGFRIVGGTEEGSQVSIGHIVPGGAADLDGRLFSGDEIIAVDNVSVINSSHHQVVGLMGSAAQNRQVTLTVQRRIYQQQDYAPTRPVEYPYDITVTRRENEGFGFVIISSASRAGSTIGRIITGSPAERCGRLHIGDRILAVNRVDISTLHHGDIVNLIKDSGYSVVLTVGPPLDEVSSNASNSHRSSTGSMVTAQALPSLVPPGSANSSVKAESPERSAPVAYQWQPQHHQSPSYNSYFSQPHGGHLNGLKSASDQEDHELNMLEMDDQYYAVELGRGARGFGFSIRGGREFHSMPLFVLRIAVDGPAAADGRLRVGDQIVEINGVNTKNMTHAEAIELIKSGGNVVRLLVKRGKVPPAAIMGDMGLSPLSPTPLPSGATMPASSASTGRPVSAMSQPMTASGYMLPQGAMPLPGLTTNGMVPNGANNNYSGSNNNGPHNNGLSNGPVGHSSPRVAPPGQQVLAADPYYWNQY